MSFVDILFKMNIFRASNGWILIRTKLYADETSCRVNGSRIDQRELKLLLNVGGVWISKQILFWGILLGVFFWGGEGDFCFLFFLLTILSPFFLPYFHLYTCFIFHVIYFISVKLGPKYFLNVWLDLGLQEAQSVEYGIKQCQEMSVVLRRLIVDGKCFNFDEILRIVP